MDLSIVILNYNGRSWLERLLPSIENYYLSRTAHQVEVVVIDNASTDSSLSFLRNIKWIRLIESDQNGGYAYGNNLALKNNPARYMLLLNSDTEFLENGSDLDALVAYLDAHEQAGIITPRIEFPDGKIDPACHRGEPTPWAAFTYFSGLEKCFPFFSVFSRYHLSYKKMDTIHSIDCCTGAAMMVRGSALAKVGLLDERFFMYAEDVDWCKRFREAGYQVVFYPRVKIIHHKYQSGKKNSDFSIQKTTTQWFYETMLQYYDKHYRSRYPEWVRLLLMCFVRSKQRSKT